MQVARLRCGYLENPVGIGDIKPSFSWILLSNERNVKQESYHLQVSPEKDFNNLIWDTGRVNSSESTHLEYAGPSLKSSTRYYYRIKVTDNYGNESPWSDKAFFETGLLDNSEWKGKFISPEGEGEGESSKGKLLRKEFKLESDIVFARIYATARGMYELYINGKRVGESLLAPGWTEYRKRLQYQTYDVTDLLRTGANAVGASLGAGWYKGDLAGWMGRRNVYGDRIALLFQMLVRYKDGHEELIVSDETWKASDGPVVYSELYHGESYDARLEKDGWDRPGFDDVDWSRAEIVRGDMSLVVAQDGVMVIRQEKLEPVSMFKTPKNELIIDFGQNLTGWVKFNVRGNPGDRVVLKHAEVLDAQGNFYTENLRSAKCRIEYILKGEGTESFEPHFTFQGFRYVKIEEYPGDVDTGDFQAIVIHSDMEQTGRFTCSNELLNQLHHNILWGLKGNFVDIPTDCPQRDERLGWTGDAQVFMKAACYLMGTGAFFRKWFRDIRAGQLPDGGIPHVIPDILSKVKEDGTVEDYGATGWGDAAVICPWIFYQTYGDRGILEEQYESMKAWIEFIRNRAQDGVLWNTGFHFGDWLALDAKEGSCFGATPNDLTATAFYAYSTSLLAKAAKVLGKNDDAEEYTKLHMAIADAYRQEFFTPKGRLAAPTQTAHILSLMFGLVPEEYKPRTLDGLIKLMDENDGHLTTGFLGTPYFCHVLSGNGKLKEAYDLLLKEDYPSWLYQVKMGATTIWEHWDGIKPDGSMWDPGMNSFNHYAYGAIADWLYGVVAGLDTDPEKPGFKRAFIRPQPGGGLTYAEAEYVSLYGKIRIKWEIKDGSITIDLLVPHNTTACLTLPNAAGKKISGDRDICFKPCGNDCEGEIGSGEYRFVYLYTE